MIRAVIFDMDGVIIDSEKDYKQIEWDMYAEMGLPVSEEEAMESMGTVCRDWWQTLKNRYHFEQSAEELAAREDRLYVEYLFDDSRPKTMMPGADALLVALKERGLKTAVASSSVPQAIERVLGLFKIEQYFDKKVSGHEVKAGKPAPDVFLKAAEHLGVLPEECLVVEDSYNGIRAAKAAGMQCIAYLSAPEGVVDYTLADYKVADFADFFDVTAPLFDNH